MKTIALLLLFALSGLTVNAKPKAQVSFDFFYDTLAPYGEWASAADYGYVWRPADVDEDWTPYTDGYWAYTDAGWTWVSYEEWGGIPYHYGRWARLEDFGWCWVPDYEWGPAWVSWRQSDDYVGWAPLPPEARWRRTTGFGTWVDTEYDIGPSSFRFCHSRDFGAPVLRPVLLPRTRNLSFIEQTINITNITYRGDRGFAFNGGPDYRRLSALSPRPLPALKLVRHTEDIFKRGSRGNVFHNAPRGNTLVVSAPPVAAGIPETPADRRPVARSFPKAKIDRGWSGTPHDPAHERIRAHFKQQTAGASPQTAPARPFQPGLVAAVPKKGDPKAKVVSASPIAILPGSQPANGAPGASPASEFNPAAPPALGDRRPSKSRGGERSPVSPPTVVGEPGGKMPSKLPDAPFPAQPPVTAQPTVPKGAPPLDTLPSSPTTKPLQAPPTNNNDPRVERSPKKPSKITELSKPATVAPPATPNVAPAPPATPSAQPPPVAAKTPAGIPEIRSEKVGKKPARNVEATPPAVVPPASPMTAAAPQPLPRIAAPPIAPPKDDSGARIAREQAELAGRKRDAEKAARATEQLRAGEGARKQQMILDEKQKQGAAAAGDRQRRDAAAGESSNRMAEAQRAAAKEQARAADGQRAAEAMRQRNEMNARRAADEGRRKSVVPHPAPIQLPPPQARPNPVMPPIQPPAPQARPERGANPAPATPGDPRRSKGKDEKEKK